MSLILADDDTTHALITELMAAARRGVRVNIAADSFTYSEFGGYFSPLKRIKVRSRASTAMAKRLTQAGITFTWLGRSYKLNPFKGITHIKWAVVDNTTYTFGGVNLYNEGIESTDYMLKSSSTSLAKQISQQHSAIIKSDASPHAYPGFTAITPHGTIYIDSGKPKESLIYERICELAVQAERVLLVSQYCPSGALVKHLRHDNAHLYFNPPRNAPYPTNLLILFTQLRTKLKSYYARNAYLHAKFVIFTMPGGEKITITGSHNLTHRGVVFGTREVALETNDPHVSAQLEAFHRAHVI